MILNWDETFRAGPARCGGKGYNLARLHRYGFPVPRGGVLPADVYSSFIRPFPIDRFAGLAADQAVTAAKDLAALRGDIERARLPVDLRAFLPDAVLAIRSSAVAEDGAKASFAGIHRSILDVRDPDARERAVLACFASLWTPHAVAYRRVQGVSDADAACAVVLCEMVPSAAAGVAFSCDPRTGRRDVIVIDSARGQGEQVVSGSVTPDHVEVRLARGRAEIMSRTGDSLSPAQAIELARHVERIHWALGEGQDPQDVEWAHDGRRFWFLQSRPVTRLPRHTFEPAKSMPLYWSTANIKDAVPGVVSMLAWSLIHEAIDDVLYAVTLASGYAVPPGMQTVKRIDGRAYFDLTAILWCCYDFAGSTPERTAASIGGHQPTIPVPPGDPLSGPEGERRRRGINKVVRRMLFFPGRLRLAIRIQFKEVRALLAENPTTKDGIRAGFERLGRLHETFNSIVGFANGFGPAFHDPVLQLLAPVAGDRAEALLTRLAAGGGGFASAEHGFRIDDLAAAARRDPKAKAWLEARRPLAELPPSPFRRELEKFLHDFGHRAVYEADLLNPRWGDDPEYILEQVRRHVDLEPLPRDTGLKIRNQAWEEVKRKLGFWKRIPLAIYLNRMRWGYAARENAKSALAASMWPTRRLALECGRLLRLPRPELAFHLGKSDLMAFLTGLWDGAGATELALDREARRAEWLNLPEPPDVVTEGGPSVRTEAPPPDPDQAQWAGIAVSSGHAKGRARLVRHPDDGTRLAKGDVLVAPSTDPGWTPLFLRAGGLVMETGGFLSHGAIVAREFGIPAVVNVPGVMKSVREEEFLGVDGDRGLVYRAGPTAGSDSEPR